jgi:hypothetical protein
MLLDGQYPRQRRVIRRDELLQPPLSLDERLGSQVLPVEPRQVEGGIVQPATAREQSPEIHPALIIQSDHLAVENGIPGVELCPDSEGQVPEPAEYLLAQIFARSFQP